MKTIKHPFDKRDDIIVERGRGFVLLRQDKLEGGFHTLVLHKEQVAALIKELAPKTRKPKTRVIGGPIEPGCKVIINPDSWVNKLLPNHGFNPLKTYKVLGVDSYSGFLILEGVAFHHMAERFIVVG